ncbi:MAG: UvrB/UvrC motif-containing protein [Clostridia bacterium]|nr:UvrB/UvrC motif-containing protein [Clostridia bacterium]
MKCENCGNNEANVRYTQIVNGAKKEMHLCEECARELGITNMNFNFDMPFGFSNFFGEFLNDYNDGFMPTLALPKTMTCDNCGLTFDDFVENGKFGCAHCYDTFENRLDPIFKRLHGGNRYIGRKAKKANPENDVEHNEAKEENKEESKLEALKQELKKKIKEEKYEEAAKIRDEIKKLEK